MPGIATTHIVLGGLNGNALRNYLQAKDAGKLNFEVGMVVNVEFFHDDCCAIYARRPGECNCNVVIEVDKHPVN